MNSNTNQTPERTQRKEVPGAVGLAWIESESNRIAPARLGGQSYDDQERVLRELAKKHHVRLRLVITRYGKYREMCAVETIADLLTSARRHHLRHVIVPYREWASRAQDVLNLIREILELEDIILITAE